LTITTGYGDIQVDLIAAHAAGGSLKSGYGDIEVDSPSTITGKLVLKTGYGHINASSAGGKVVNQKASAIIAGDESAPGWTVSTGYGDIQIKSPGN
jgi:DUF4097 and DUF4098 domain-containing protein YvlB